MNERNRAMVRFLKFLAGGPAHLGLRDGGETAVLTSDRGGIQNFPAALIDAAVSRGLVRRSGTHAALETAARSYLRRAASEREQASSISMVTWRLRRQTSARGRNACGSIRRNRRLQHWRG
jgi:hypothetical protein